MHHFLQSFGAIVRIWTLECCACCVTDIGQDLDRFFEHDPECVSSPITTKSSIVLSQGLFFLIFNDLYIHLVVRGPMNRSIQTESNYRDSSVNCEPDPITRPTVTPAALYLLEPIDTALLSSEAASRPVNVLDTGFRIDGKMKKEVYHFTI